MSSPSRTSRFLLLLLVAGIAHGQELEIAVSPTPVGSGARAAGMADAFVAIADDATAASWNPAGLVQLERPELSIVGSWNAVQETFSADWHPEFDGRHGTSNLDLNYLSVVYPLPVLLFERNAVVSLNYQRKYDFSREFTFRRNLSDGIGVELKRLDFEQEGGLATVSPAFAVELTQRLSAGLSLNLWRSTFLSENRWTQDTKRTSIPVLPASAGLFSLTAHEEYRDFSGENVTAGLLWTPNYRWSIGLRYDSAFSGTVKYSSRLRDLGIFPLGRGMVNTGDTGQRHERREVRFPASLALGAAYRVNDRLTLSADMTRTDWHDFYVKDVNGRRNSLVDFSNLDDPWRKPNLDPTHTVRFGAEYVMLPHVPRQQLKRLWTLRGGLFYDEEPATGRPTGFYLPRDRGSGDPDPFYGFAAGLGLLLNQRLNIDVAYQLRYGAGVNKDMVRGVTGFEEDVMQHRALLSMVLYF